MVKEMDDLVEPVHSPAVHRRAVLSFVRAGARRGVSKAFGALATLAVFALPLSSGCDGGTGGGPGSGGAGSGGAGAGASSSGGGGSGLGSCSVTISDAMNVNVDGLASMEIPDLPTSRLGNYDADADQSDVAYTSSDPLLSIALAFAGKPSTGSEHSAMISLLRQQKQWLASMHPVTAVSVAGTTVRLVFTGAAMQASAASGATGSFSLGVDCTIEGFGGL